jgi:hypothetical protein
MGVPMMFVCVALTPGRVVPSYLPTVNAMEQPRAILPLSEVKPSLLFCRKIHKKIENPSIIPNPLKLKLGKKCDISNWLVNDAKGLSTKGTACDVLLRKRA